MSIQELDARSYPTLAPLCKPDLRDTVFDRLCEVAHAVPTQMALVADDGAVTFDQLVHRAYAFARKIARLAPDDSEPIAVEGSCTVEAITLMLAVIASGHALVPLDSNLPVARQEQILNLAGARRLRLADIENVDDSSEPLPVVKGDRVAIIAFTSGSSGTAKGVLLSNRMCLSKAYEVSSALGLSPYDRVGNALPVSFGAGINTVVAGIASGATVYCLDPRSTLPNQLLEWISEHALTTLHCSPSLVRSVAASSPAAVQAAAVQAAAVRTMLDNDVPSLKFVTTYGEPLHASDVEAFRSVSGSEATFVNWYATTEAGGVASRKYRVGDPLPAGFLAAGTAPNGKKLDIVRSNGSIAARGEIGQVRVTGDCFADGYLNLPDQTDARFTTDAGRLRYWTGDLGRIDDDGVLQLVGRADDAVKIRGYQVEPAEVEGALRSLAGISDASVIAYDNDTIPDLAAFFVGTTYTADEVRSALREKLPEWMVPKFITRLESIPRTERGKVDRSSLPDASVRPDELSDSALSGATENWLAHLVGYELGLTSVNPDADFAELGATSLVATKLLVAIRVAFHVELTPAEFISAMTVHRLAKLIDDRHASLDRAKARSHANPILVPLRAEGSNKPLFVVAGAGVPAVGLASLARLLEDRPVYALQAKGLDTRAFPHRTLSGAAHAYVREIQRDWPHGPYNVAGHSLGAWIALEMAEILRSQGEVVEQVVLLDPRLYRSLLDKLPGGERLEAAPPDPGNPLYKPNAWVIAKQVLKVATAGIVRFRTTERWLAFGIIGSMALKWHKPKPWDGPVTVVVTESNTSDRRSWEAIATGSLTVTEVPGNHIGLMREPVVATVAEVIERAMSPGMGPRR